MSDIKWIKVMTDMFDNRKIKQIETLPEGDSIIVIWLKLLCLAGNVNEQGLIYFTKEIPYTEEMMATEFNRPVNTVRLALKTFEEFQMIEIIDNIIMVSNWEKYQNIEGMDKVREQTRRRVAKHREKQKLLLEKNSNVTCNVTVTKSNATDKEEEKEIEKEIETPPPPNNIFLFLGKNDHVQLTQEQLFFLISKYGQERTDLIITRLDNYIEKTGKRYKSHFETLKRWIREDMKKGGQC